MEEPAHESAGGDDHGFSKGSVTKVCFDALNGIILDENSDGIPLPKRSAASRLEGCFRAKLVSLFVTLGSRGPNGGPTGRIQHPKLDGRGVGIQAHETAKGIDFPHDLAFGLSTDGWVAGHLAERIEILGQEKGEATEATRSKGSLDASVASAEDDDVILDGIGEHSGELTPR
jgi:hypothetical protein